MEKRTKIMWDEKNDDDDDDSTRFVVKLEGGQQCIFDVFLTKQVGGQ